MVLNLKRLGNFLGMLVLVTAYSGQGGTDQGFWDAVFTGDTRMDLNEVNNSAVLNLASSTVALMTDGKLSPNGDGTIAIKGMSFKDRFNLCPSEPFSNQTSAAFCSGVLVSPDTVLTAGHCVTSAIECANANIVFGFSILSASRRATTVPANQVYKCAQIIYREDTDGGPDFALLKLNRAVTDHAPVILRTAGQVNQGDRLFAIGHPSGLPTKVALGEVQSAKASSYFVTDLDTYSGNSGSAVFNSNTGLVEGILVRGGEDFVTSGRQSCKISRRETGNLGPGEDVMRISEVLPFLNRTDLSLSAPSVSTSGANISFNKKENTTIPDNNSSGIFSEMNVDKVPQGRHILVGVNITHAHVGDLVVTVTAPDGRFVVLSNREGGSGQDIVNSFTADDLDQESKTGKWKMSVSDNAAGDVGVLHSWNLKFQN